MDVIILRKVLQEFYIIERDKTEGATVEISINEGSLQLLKLSS